MKIYKKRIVIFSILYFSFGASYSGNDVKIVQNFLNLLKQDRKYTNRDACKYFSHFTEDECILSADRFDKKITYNPCDSEYLSKESHP